jgi:hypothetical protein
MRCTALAAVIYAAMVVPADFLAGHLPLTHRQFFSVVCIPLVAMQDLRPVDQVG